MQWKRSSVKNGIFFLQRSSLAEFSTDLNLLRKSGIILNGIRNQFAGANLKKSIDKQFCIKRVNIHVKVLTAKIKQMIYIIDSNNWNHLLTDE